MSDLEHWVDDYTSQLETAQEQNTILRQENALLKGALSAIKDAFKTVLNEQRQEAITPRDAFEAGWIGSKFYYMHTRMRKGNDAKERELAWEHFQAERMKAAGPE